MLRGARRPKAALETEKTVRKNRAAIGVIRDVTYFFGVAGLGATVDPAGRVVVCGREADGGVAA